MFSASDWSLPPQSNSSLAPAIGAPASSSTTPLRVAPRSSFIVYAAGIVRDRFRGDVNKPLQYAIGMFEAERLYGLNYVVGQSRWTTDWNFCQPVVTDSQGNYTIGIKEQIVFLEIDRDKVSRVSGMDITICTTAKTNEEGFALLEEMGMPFRKQQ